MNNTSIYRETFDDGPAGWWGWGGNHIGLQTIPHRDSYLETISPWWIDYNHAPPGAGYLHMLFCLTTKGPLGEQIQEAAGPNRFVQGGFSRNFENAEIRVRVRGEMKMRGANVVLLIQAGNEGVTAPWALTSQPIIVEPEWREQTLCLRPNESEWTCLKGRHDRQDYYAERPLETCLRDVNVNLMLIAFPLDIVPMGDPGGDIHALRPERDYPVWRSNLPEGRLQLDQFEIHYP
jgi:hypothetical protein